MVAPNLLKKKDVFRCKLNFIWSPKPRSRSLYQPTYRLIEGVQPGWQGEIPGLTQEKEGRI